MILIVLYYKNNIKIIKIIINLKINRFIRSILFSKLIFLQYNTKRCVSFFFSFFHVNLNIASIFVFNPNKLFKETNFSDLSSDWFLFHSSTSFRSCSGPPWASTYTHTTKHVGRSRFKAGFEDLRSSRVALRT